VTVSWGAAHSLINHPHQVLKVGEDVGVRLVTVLGHYFPINDYVKFSVRPRGELEAGYVLTSPAQSLSCHPGSAQSVSSILTVKNLYIQFLCSSQTLPSFDD
jgi:hypothetical protein